MQQQTCSSNAKVSEFALSEFAKAPPESRRPSLLSDDQAYYNDLQEHIRSPTLNPDDPDIPDCDDIKIHDLWDTVRQMKEKMVYLESRPSVDMSVLSQVSFWKL